MDIHGRYPVLYDTAPRIDNTEYRIVPYDTREWIHGTIRSRYSYDTGLHSICLPTSTGSDIAPRQPTLKSDSSGTITSVMYAL